MATNRDLLKEAIADAKAVKEMAIANAKAALEESFTPQLKSMLSAKLQEMEEEEDLDEAGFGPMINVKGHGNIEDESSLYEEDKEEMDEDLDLNELLGELNEEEEEESEEEEEESEEEGEPLDLEDMTDEDLKKMIEDVIADMIASGELEAGEEGEKEEMEDMGGEVEDEEEVNLDELLAEIEEMEEEAMYEEDETMDESSLEEELEEIFGLGKKGSGGTSFVKTFIKNNSAEIEKIASSKDEDAGKKLVAKFYNENVRKMDSSALRSDISVLRTALGMSALGGAEKGTVSITELESELAEAYSTIETLRKDLNEVNLLNAKLLYTNKIFKAKNLTESQKVKVLNAFDKATTVKETKLVFETLSEGLKETKSPIKESLGMASKTVGTTNTKQPIVESNDMVSRFQKLAGII